jgi:hypothetical protein
MNCVNILKRWKKILIQREFLIMAHKEKGMLEDP